MEMVLVYYFLLLLTLLYYISVIDLKGNNCM